MQWLYATTDRGNKSKNIWFLLRRLVNNIKLLCFTMCVTN